MAELMEFLEGNKWKVEPASPEQCTPDYLDIERLLESSTCYDQEYITGDRVEIATKLLEDLNALVKHEDQQFPDWFEEKTELPIFDVLPQFVTCEGNNAGIGHQLNESMVKPVLTSLDYHLEQPTQPSPPPPPPPAPQPMQVVASPLFVPVIETDTTQLLQEFEYVLNRHDTLTPPDSPRDEDIITLLQGMQPSELDELVASRVEDSLYTEPVISGAKSPGCVSVSSSICGGEESDSGVQTSSESSGEDPEWLPQASDRPREHPDWVPHTSAQPFKSGESRKRKSAAGKTPYSRNGVGPDERKLRKKEQNKNAATRYRQKKKAEVEEILGEEKGLKTKNDELKLKVTDLQREIKYLKSLMRDVFRAKGYIK